MRFPTPTVVAALLLLLCWQTTASAQTLRVPCPAEYDYQCHGLTCACVAEAAVSEGPSTIPFDPIWDMETGTATQSAAGGGELLILVTPRLATAGGSASTCVAEASAAFYGPDGALLAQHQATLTPSAPAWQLSAPPFNDVAPRKALRVVAGGTASGCTLDELPRAILTTREPEGSAMRIVGERSLASTLTLAGEGVPPLVPAHVFPPAARGASPVLPAPCPADHDYQCQGLTCACVAAAVSEGPSTSLFGLIWDVASGTTTQAGQTLEVTLGFGPLPPDSTCRASGRLEILDPGVSADGALAAREVEMVAGGPILMGLSWAHPGGDALRPRVWASLDASDCLLPELAGAELVVATHESDTGRSTGPQTSARPLLILAEDAEGEALGERPLPLRPAYGFPPGLRLGGGG